MKLDQHPRVQNMPGGAAIGYLAREGDEKRYQLITSRYSAKMKDCSFSFGGMLSQVQRIIEREDISYSMSLVHLSTEGNFLAKYYLEPTDTDDQKLKDFAACIQSSIVRHIETRVHRAVLFCDAVQKPQWKRTLVC